MNKRIPFITLLITFFVLSNLSGQNAGSFLKETKDGLRILEYSKKALELSRNRDSSFVQYFSDALFIADSLNKDLYRSIIFLNLGLAHRYNNEYTKSAAFYEKSLRLSEKFKNTEIEAEVYYGLAETLSLNNNYDSAYSLLEKSLELAEDHQLPKIYNKMGDNLNSRGKNPEALEMYIKAADFYYELGDSFSLASVYNNIGVVFLDSKREEKVDFPIFRTI